MTTYDNKKEVTIFISYAREDVKKAEEIFNKLQEYGLSPWLDIKNIHPGQNWKYTIKQALLEANFFIFKFVQ